MTKTNKSEQVEVKTFKWGPCVIKINILDDFKQLLLKEALKNKNDYSDQLASNGKATEYSQKSQQIITPYLARYLDIYDKLFLNHHGKGYFIIKPEYRLNSLWCNYQKRYDFNPPHDHAGDLSFVVYLTIPEKLNKENAEHKARSCGPGGIQFMYGDGPRDCVRRLAYFPAEGDMFIFPAWLHHWVYPFKSNITRVSVSGNVYNAKK